MASDAKHNAGCRFNHLASDSPNVFDPRSSSLCWLHEQVIVTTTGYLSAIAFEFLRDTGP